MDSQRPRVTFSVKKTKVWNDNNNAAEPEQKDKVWTQLHSSNKSNGETNRDLFLLVCGSDVTGAPVDLSEWSTSAFTTACDSDLFRVQSLSVEILIKPSHIKMTTGSSSFWLSLSLSHTHTRTHSMELICSAVGDRNAIQMKRACRKTFICLQFPNINLQPWIQWNAHT